VSGFAPARNTSIQDIMASLARRGFIQLHSIGYDADAMQTQIDAVIEELGEVARLMRRVRQRRDVLDIDKLAEESADVVIAAVCLLAQVAGDGAPLVIADKLADDDARGWLHSGMTRKQYEDAKQRAVATG